MSYRLHTHVCFFRLLSNMFHRTPFWRLQGRQAQRCLLYTSSMDALNILNKQPKLKAIDSPRAFAGRCAHHTENGFISVRHGPMSSLGTCRAGNADLMRGKTRSGIPPPILLLSFSHTHTFVTFRPHLDSLVSADFFSTFFQNPMSLFVRQFP